MLLKSAICSALLILF